MMYVGFAVIVGSCLVQHPPMETWGKLETKELLSFTGGQAWPAIVSFFILGAWTLIDPGFHQRVASAKNPATGQKGIFVAILFWMLFDMLTVSTGMYALSLLPSMPENPRLIFPALGEAVLPPGLTGRIGPAKRARLVDRRVERGHAGPGDRDAQILVTGVVPVPALDITETRRHLPERRELLVRDLLGSGARRRREEGADECRDQSCPNE